MQRNPSLGRSLRPRPPKDLRPPFKEDSNLGGDLMGVNLKPTHLHIPVLILYENNKNTSSWFRCYSHLPV